MARDYLTYNDKLNQQLNMFGFKRKNMNTFIRKCSEVDQILSFTHHTNSEHYVKYYDIMVEVDIPAIAELAKKVGVVCSSGFGRQICYCIPGGSYDSYKWRIANSDEESVILGVVKDMISQVRNYAIPYFFDKYSTIDIILRSVEKNKLIHDMLRMGKNRMLPLLYLINGQSEKALDFMDNTLHELSLYTEEDAMKLRKGYELPGYKRTTPWVNKDYINYMDYVSKCKAYIDGLK